jgi:hypothetical protein
MRHNHKLSGTLRTLHLLALIQLSALALAMPALVTAQTIVPLRPFTLVELHSGGRAILRHGPTQSVTLLKGSLDYTRVAIADGGQLVINSCGKGCPRDYDMEIEIVTPDIAGILVTDGGRIESHGSFPRQAEVKVNVSQGGLIDIRSMAADSVTASVNQGGMIFTRPQTALFATVAHGGIITYWGNARVRKSVRDGGVVTRGTAAEADKPISKLNPAPPAPLPVPAVPSIRPLSESQEVTRRHRKNSCSWKFL